MRISKSAPDLLKKAVTSLKSKTDALRTKVIILASLRRRLAMVRAISRQIHVLTPSNSREKQGRVEHRSKALTMRKAMVRSNKPAGGDHGVMAHPSLFEVAMFEEDYHGYPNWTSSLFDNDRCYKNEEDVGDDDVDILGTLDEPSVIEIIRSKREVEGLEFNFDDDIDEACDMFIRRFQSRMNRSFSDFCISE